MPQTAANTRNGATVARPKGIAILATIAQCGVLHPPVGICYPMIAFPFSHIHIIYILPTAGICRDFH